MFIYEAGEGKNVVDIKRPAFYDITKKNINGMSQRA
jgi:hypothetical protein